jgi:hypothetical protein
MIQMDIARRKFLKAGAIAALLGAATPLTKGAAALGKQSGAQPARRSEPGHRATSGNRTDLLAYYGKSAFNACLNTNFQISLGASLVGKMTLDKIEELVPVARQRAAALEGKECFALWFRGSRNTSLRQNTYTFEHATLGTFEMLLVPAGADNGGSYYQATINRLDS